MTPPAMNSTLFEPTLRPLPPLLPPITDHWVLLALPIVTYWTLSLFFHFLDSHNLLERYRLHTPEEVLKRNHVTPKEVVRDVVLQQLIQTVVGGITALFEGVDMIGGEQLEILTMYTRFTTVERWGLKALALLGVNGAGLEEKVAGGVAALGGNQLLLKALELVGLEANQDWRWTMVEFVYWYIMPVVRLGFAIFVLDTWQYFLHRAMHESKWLYRTFHSRHHRLYVPYAFGALYNHPVEGLLMDTIGAGLGYKLSGMRTRGAMIFFCFSTLKTVDDHCGYSLPWDPLQKLFWNNASYHDVHHQTWGIKSNYSQPFLICWDRWLGTQWNSSEGDTARRYAASRERAAAATDASATTATIAKDETPVNIQNGTTVTTTITSTKINSVNGHATNGTVVRLSGNGVAKSNGSAVTSMNGNGVLLEEETEIELRRSSRRRVKRAA